MQMLFVAGHALDSSYPQAQVLEWWNTLVALLANSYSREAQSIWLIGSNTVAGSAQSDATGSHHPGAEHVPGAPFHELLRHWDTAPSSYICVDPAGVVA